MNPIYPFIIKSPIGLVALLVIVTGWILAWITRILLTSLLELFQFNKLSVRLGIHEFLKKGEVSRSASELTGRFVYWLILMVTFLKAANLLDNEVSTELHRQTIAAIPAFISALLILAVGLIAIFFLAGFVRTLVRNAGNPYANLWFQITRGIGVTLVLIFAIEQTRVQSMVITGIFFILFAAAAFGTALAFGLGSREIAGTAMQQWLEELKERHRDLSQPDMDE
ncbi:MAG: hypothetical protein WDA18_03905 [Candidatus Ratteibacteria bacterium]|jgi:MFS family permease